MQPVLPADDCKVGQRDLARVPVHNGREAKVPRLDLLRSDVQLVVPAVVELAPLQLPVGADEPLARLDARGETYVLTAGGGRGHGRPREFDADGPFARRRVVGMLVEPHEIRDPVRVRVARDHDVVGDVVVVQGREGPVAVGLVPVPGVVVEGVDVAVGEGLVDAAKDGLGADDAPRGAARFGVEERGVEPVFLSGAHHRPRRVVGDLVDVVRVPVEVGDGAVVLPCVEHDEVDEVAD